MLVRVRVWTPPHPPTLAASPLGLLFRSPGWFPLRFVRKVNELSPSSPFRSPSPLLSFTRWRDCSPYSQWSPPLNKKRWTTDTLIKCALETEVRETEGSSSHSRRCVGTSRDRSAKTLPRRLHIKCERCTVGKVLHVDFQQPGRYLTRIIRQNQLLGRSRIILLEMIRRSMFVFNSSFYWFLWTLCLNLDFTGLDSFCVNTHFRNHHRSTDSSVHAHTL